jgi:hypothetical protein
LWEGTINLFICYANPSCATLAGDATMATATDPAARSWSSSLRLAELHKLDSAETEEEAAEAEAAVWEFAAKGEGAATAAAEEEEEEEEEEAVRGSAAKGEREEDDEEEEEEEQTEQS